MYKHLTALLVTLTFFSSTAQERTNRTTQSEELGKVSWYRDFDVALQLSEKENKPILILFQEVPGCATCRNYGHNVLSHPLMTEAIENEFIPLAIFNNKKGKDAVILKKYNEPSWNNPVVRMANENGETIGTRLASDYSAKGLYQLMEKTLETYGNPIPEYMRILGKELGISASNMKETHFKMYCFWTGEKELGSKEGVLATQAGFMNGAEVVRVVYDASKVSEEQLTTFATKRQMSPIAKTTFQWSERDEDYYLQHSRYKYLPLSEVQKTKINSALGKKESPLPYLSPKQKQWFQQVGKANAPVLFDQDFFAAWDKLLTEK